MNIVSKTTESTAKPGRREIRRLETRAEIVAAAWELVRTNGLAGLAMRDLGDQVGMKAQSIYSYFASKHEIFDAMFLEGYQAFLLLIENAAEDKDSSSDFFVEAKGMAHQFFDFCTSDPVRYQLLFQRTIPGFVPSTESYGAALEAYQAMSDRLGRFGITEAESLDLWTATLTGLVDQQISNDPGGDRWEQIIDRAIHMVLREIAPQLLENHKGQE